jgi:hypothetical protein
MLRDLVGIVTHVGEGGEKHDEELFCAVEAMLG